MLCGTSVAHAAVSSNNDVMALAALTLPPVVNTLVADAQSLASLARSPATAIQRVEVHTKYLPVITASMPLGPSVPGAEPSKPDLLVRFMQPKVRLVLAAPFSPIDIVPAGEPGPTQWPTLRWALLAAGAMGAYFMFRGLTCGVTTKMAIRRTRRRYSTHAA